LRGSRKAEFFPHGEFLPFHFSSESGRQGCNTKHNNIQLNIQPLFTFFWLLEVWARRMGCRMGLRLAVNGIMIAFDGDRLAFYFARKALASSLE
jgi:hypothetical protein